MEVVEGKWVGKRCLVTGGAGCIGSNLVRRLLAEGAIVTVVDNLATGRLEYLPIDDRLRVVTGDLGVISELPALVAEAEYIFHLAAQVGNVKSISQPESDAQTNIVASVRLFNACRAAGGRRIVYSSSSAIFGEAEELPISETHPQRPASFYALSKLTAEKYALLAASLWQLPVVCLRYFNVYGWPIERNEYTGVIAIFFDRLQHHQCLTIYGDGRQIRDFVYVEDIVQANLRAALYGKPGAVYNIGTGQPTTIEELAQMMRQVTGQAVDIVYRPGRAGEVRESLAAIELACRELGYTPQYDLQRGLTELWQQLSLGE